jgi:hypothetical protein
MEFCCISYDDNDYNIPESIITENCPISFPFHVTVAYIYSG